MHTLWITISGPIWSDRVPYYLRHRLPLTERVSLSVGEGSRSGREQPGLGTRAGRATSACADTSSGRSGRCVPSCSRRFPGACRRFLDGSLRGPSGESTPGRGARPVGADRRATSPVGVRSGRWRPAPAGAEAIAWRPAAEVAASGAGRTARTGSTVVDAGRSGSPSDRGRPVRPGSVRSAPAAALHGRLVRAAGAGGLRLAVDVQWRGPGRLCRGGL